VRVLPPNTKRKFQGCGVHLHVVVADQNDIGGDVVGAQEEAVVEAGVLVNLKIEMILDKSEVVYNTFRLNQISGFNQNCSIG